MGSQPADVPRQGAQFGRRRRAGRGSRRASFTGTLAASGPRHPGPPFFHDFEMSNATRVLRSLAHCWARRFRHRRDGALQALLDPGYSSFCDVNATVSCTQKYPE